MELCCDLMILYVATKGQKTVCNVDVLDVNPSVIAGEFHICEIPQIP